MDTRRSFAVRASCAWSNVRARVSARRNAAGASTTSAMAVGRAKPPRPKAPSGTKMVSARRAPYPALAAVPKWLPNQ